ncbi:hypothetical protein GOP47_0019051 [Adiantum capillus-veneris]|uniref:Uncharacterized protein n=1 Tax=Adiantum capillus-veneris TaxID=13818 RepID=A0A9D4ZA62_ADICA|nr:hypothetical protein GOP47_0019051 [Adiantum capillus-veneris]
MHTTRPEVWATAHNFDRQVQEHITRILSLFWHLRSSLHQQNNLFSSIAKDKLVQVKLHDSMALPLLILNENPFVCGAELVFHSG